MSKRRSRLVYLPDDGDPPAVSADSRHSGIRMENVGGGSPGKYGIVPSHLAEAAKNKEGKDPPGSIVYYPGNGKPRVVEHLGRWPVQ